VEIGLKNHLKRDNLSKMVKEHISDMARKVMSSHTAHLATCSHICECWRVIGEDTGLLASVLTHLLELLSTRLPYEELPCTRDRGRTIRTATLMPVAVSPQITSPHGRR